MCAMHSCGIGLMDLCIYIVCPWLIRDVYCPDGSHYCVEAVHGLLCIQIKWHCDVRTGHTICFNLYRILVLAVGLCDVR